MREVLHIYTRVSTTVQEEEGTSLETQKESGIQRANKLDMEYKIWNEGAQSSSYDDLSNRPILVQILHLITTKNIKHLYVWNTDRLSRNMTTWGMIRLKLIQNNIILHTPTGEQILSDPQTNLMIGIMSEISQYDNQLRTERFRLGKFHRIKQGYWMGGPPPYGYQIIKSKLVPNEDEVKWLKFIFESYRNGNSIDEIRTTLMHNGVVTRRGNSIWSHGSIASLLTNTHYGGYYNFTDHKTNETIRVDCESILLPSLIYDVQKQKQKRTYRRIDSKRTKTSVQKHTYLLNNLLYCGHCGSTFFGNYKETQTSYYSCSLKTKQYKLKYTEKETKCTSKRNIRLDTTDSLVWDSVVDILSNSSIFKEMIKQDILKNKTYVLSKKSILDIQSKIKKIYQENNKITDSIVSLEVNKILKDRNHEEIKKIIKGLEEQRLENEVKKENLEKQLILETKNTEWIDWIKLFGKKVKDLKNDNLTIQEKKEFLSGVVEKIIITSKDTQTHEIKLQFKLPYYNDELKWLDTKKKSKGYIIQDGMQESVFYANLLQKKTII